MGKGYFQGGFFSQKDAVPNGINRRIGSLGYIEVMER
jgi:hypothetical protein